MQCRKTAAGGHRQEKSRPADRQDVHVDPAARRTAAKHQPTTESHHERKKVSKVTEQAEENVGEIGADHATIVIYPLRRTAVKPSRILRVITHHGQQQIGCQGGKNEQSAFAQAFRDVRMHLLGFRLFSTCLSQNEKVR
jgi:hypothetical protein